MTKAKTSGLWAGAGGVLLLLTFINLFNYLDRYILVALSPSIKKELELTDTQVGFLTTAFMFSYFLISPIFGWLGDHKPRYKVMAAGVALWSIATAASGWAKGFGALLGARFCVGVGEAAYGAIAPSLLTDLFPKTIRGKVFSIFFVAIPVGSALGFLLGGALEKWVGWRSAFLLAGAPGIALALFLLFLREPKRGAHDEGIVVAKQKLKEVYWALSANSTYVITVLGYCAYTFVVGGIAVWIPHYIERYLGVSAANGNMAFGAITVVAGFLGTILGGGLADRWQKRSGDAYLKLSAISMIAALPAYILALSTSSFLAFCLFVFVLEFLLFLSTSPVNAEIVNCVPPHMRATANAVGIFMIHLLGDAISPTLVGWISDHSNLHLGMQVFSVAIFLSGLIWALKPVFLWECLPWPQGALKLPEAQCHRGFHLGGAQENTLQAFQAAAKAGAKMVELDVRLSKDGVPVVVHDPDIKRISGKEGRVDKMSASDLAIKANVPTLEEVLKAPGCQGLLVNVEIKSDSAKSTGLEMAVAEVIVRNRAEGRVLFSSFNPLALRRLSRALPNVPRALLATEERAPGNRFYLRKMLLASLARPHILHLDYRFFTDKLAKSLEMRRVPVAVWTVEDPEIARKCLAKGAKSIISPLPGIL